MQAATDTNEPPTESIQGVCPVSDRAERLKRLQTEHFDVLVVGGGVTGAGVARDARLRGLKTAIVERADWAYGTSSRSSKLVHGGLRYLENFEFGLVFEALRERAIQRKLNPHLVWPQPFVFPVYKGQRNSLFKMRLGLWVYDLLTVFRTFRWHRALNPAETIRQVEGLGAEDLTGSVHYYDCATDDARLTLANVLDAERKGATTLNYVAFDSVLYNADGEHVVGARVRDALTGESMEVQCRHVVLAGGPWTDTFTDAPGGGHLMRPTKGVHIVVEQHRLPVDKAVVLLAPQDGRVVFTVPWANMTYVGTTDTDFDGDFDEVRATSDDVSYLLDTVNHFFPEAKLTGSDVTGTWAGVRPLIRSDEASTGKTSREHQRYDDPRGITTIAGGKLTTYRSMAAEVVDAVLRWLKGTTAAPKTTKCETHLRPLDPDLPQVVDPASGPLDETDNHLWRHYGSGREWIRRRWETHPEEAVRLDPALPYTMAEVTFVVRFQHALTLQDVLVRRLQVYYRLDDQGLRIAEAVATHQAALLQQGPDWVRAQVESYEAEVNHGLLGALALTTHELSTPANLPLDEPKVAEASVARSSGLP